MGQAQPRPTLTLMSSSSAMFGGTSSRRVVLRVSVAGKPKRVVRRVETQAGKRRSTSANVRLPKRREPAGTGSSRLFPAGTETWGERSGWVAEREGLTSNLLQQESPFRHGPGPTAEHVVKDLLKIAI